MNLILEGPDCAGKTTLSWKLLDIQGGARIHNGVWDDPFRAYLMQFHGALLSRGASFVWDRFWPSNYIYSPIMGGVQLDERQRHVCLSLSHYLDCVVVVCRRPHDDVLRDWRARKGQEYVPQEAKMVQVCLKYDDPAEAVGHLPRVAADPFEESPESILTRAFDVGSHRYRGFNERWGATWRDCLK